MIESHIRNLLAERIGGNRYGKSTAIYKFERIKRAKQAAREADPGREIIDMGVGEPDDMADAGAVRLLAEEAARPENRGYADNGGERLRGAAAGYLREVFGVEADETELGILHSIGSKAALSILPAVLVDPGDVVLMTTPGYPVFGTHAAYYGGEVHNLPLLRRNGFLPDLEAIPGELRRRAKVLVLNYPNNPTGAGATGEFFGKVVEFARTNDLVVVHDAAYAALIFEGRPLSFLSVPGALEVGVELHSASKAFNMTGWRCGFVAGNPLLVRAYGDMKDNTDSGQFLAIQHAVAWCLENPRITEAIAGKYSRRMDGLVEVLRRSGFDAGKPRGSFFLYVPAPRAVTTPRGERIPFSSAEDASQWLIRRRLISTVPWDEAGAFLRFSVTFAARDEEQERRVLDELAARLQGFSFEFP